MESHEPMTETYWDPSEVRGRWAGSWKGGEGGRVSKVCPYNSIPTGRIEKMRGWEGLESSERINGHPRATNTPTPPTPPPLLWLAAVRRDSSSIEPRPPATTPLLQRKHAQPRSVSVLLSFFPLLQAGWSLFALKCLKKVAYQAPVVFWKPGGRGGATWGVGVAAANPLLNIALEEGETRSQ